MANVDTNSLFYEGTNLIL